MTPSGRINLGSGVSIEPFVYDAYSWHVLIGEEKIGHITRRSKQRYYGYLQADDRHSEGSRFCPTVHRDTAARELAEAFLLDFPFLTEGWRWPA